MNYSMRNKKMEWKYIEVVNGGVKIPAGVTKIEYTPYGRVETIMTHEEADAEIGTKIFRKKQMKTIISFS